MLRNCLYNIVVENKVFNNEVAMIQNRSVEHITQLINETNPQGVQKADITQAQLRAVVEALAWDGELHEYFENLVAVRARGHQLG
jgi:hypothetical protein